MTYDKEVSWRMKIDVKLYYIIAERANRLTTQATVRIDAENYESRYGTTVL